MTETPAIALTIAFWLHMLATVSWVGGQAVLSLVVFPASRKTLTPQDHHQLITVIIRRMNTVGWISLGILIGTGMIQLGANPNYTGFLGINSSWAVAILLKHITFGGILLLGAYQTWGLSPAIERIALLRAKGKASQEEQDALRQRESRILLLNTLLSVVVLFFTALARIS